MIWPFIDEVRDGRVVITNVFIQVLDRLDGKNVLLSTSSSTILLLNHNTNTTIRGVTNKTSSCRKRDILCPQFEVGHDHDDAAHERSRNQIKFMEVKTKYEIYGNQNKIGVYHVGIAIHTK